MHPSYKILIATGGYPGILAIGELFALGYKPEDLIVVALDPDELFSAFCRLKFLEIHETFDKYEYDILLSVNFRKLISNSILNRAHVGAINLHPAITQKYRGCWGSSWSLINNESVTGYTWHYMDERFDTGDVILQGHVDILPNDTAHSLYYKIYPAAIKNLQYVLNFAGKPGVKQETIGTYYSSRIPFNGEIDPTWDQAQIERFQRAMYFPPHK